MYFLLKIIRLPKNTLLEMYEISMKNSRIIRFYIYCILTLELSTTEILKFMAK